jgi:hypothetical protein
MCNLGLHRVTARFTSKSAPRAAKDDNLLTAKILLTIATPGYCAVPALFNSSNTHATNSPWTAHARDHVVSQVGSYIYNAILALVQIWTANTNIWPQWIAALMASRLWRL